MHPQTRSGSGTRHLLLVSLLVLLAAGPSAPAAFAAVQVYHNGTILTMQDHAPRVEAVAVRDGRILDAGPLARVEEAAGAGAEKVDLRGRTLMPGFIDSHSHLGLAGTKLALANMSNPPAGPITSIRDIQEGFRQWIREHGIEPGEVAAGWGYDHTQLAEQRHPTRDDLDQVSREIPIVLIHFSTHQTVLNSAALARFGIDENTPDPEGGRILREADGKRPNGILQETASIPVKLEIFGADYQEKKRRILKAQQNYLENGFTTAMEAAVLDQEWVDAFRHLGRDGDLKLDIAGLAFFKVADELLKNYEEDRHYRDRFRLAGVKLILDGGSPGRSAFLRDPYYQQKEGEDRFRGVPLFPRQEDIDRMVSSYYEKGWQAYIHALGDAAVDQAIHAMELAEKAHPGKARRTQIIHAQLFHQDQIEKVAGLDASVSFQIAHVYYFGDFHRKETFGPRLAEHLCPVRSALDRGLSVSIHHDAPVHPADQMFLIWNAVNRVTRSGHVLGPDERVSVMDALKASTIDAAWQLFEETDKGSIEPGKLADSIVLSENPLEVEPMQLKDIRVLQTIKEGQTVFER